jgi:hypothetical protein
MPQNGSADLIFRDGGEFSELVASSLFTGFSES